MIETNNLIACVDIAHTLEYINAKHKRDSDGIAISPDARITIKGMNKMSQSARHAYTALLTMIEGNVRSLCDNELFFPECERKKQITIYRIRVTDGVGVNISGISPNGHGFRATAKFEYDSIVANDNPIAARLNVRDNQTRVDISGITLV